MPPEPSYVIVAGARPNFMKVAPLCRALSRKDAAGGPGPRVVLVHTGQHYDPLMSEVFFRELGIPRPDHHLGVGSGTHAEQTGQTMISFEKVLLGEFPRLVVVVGDVNSTIACSLTARKLGIPVAHVEAGLRSFDLEMPEEINRRLTDAISDFLFVTEESGVANLRREGVEEERIFLVGNVMIDTLLRFLPVISSAGFVPGPSVKAFTDRHPVYALLTLHRPSNVDDPAALSRLWGAIREISREIPVLFPVHPRTRGRFADSGLDSGRVTFIDPVGYLDMLWAMRGAALVLTDSGGIQEETTALGVPCVTLRNNTERPVTVEVGTNILAGTRPESILAAVRTILAGKAGKGGVPPLWDGHAAERIAKVLLQRVPTP